jgi:hypothetical protein
MAKDAVRLLGLRMENVPCVHGLLDRAGGHRACMADYGRAVPKCLRC